jgi:hypothetical protein
MMLRRIAPVLGVLAVMAAGPAPAKDMGPATVVGQVTNTSNKALRRRIFVTAGRQKWALHVNETSKIFHAGKEVSVHEIDVGSYVKARGWRIGKKRLDCERIDIAGDRLAFRKSDAFRRSAPEGYVVLK